MCRGMCPPKVREQDKQGPELGIDHMVSTQKKEEEEEEKCKKEFITSCKGSTVCRA